MDDFDKKKIDTLFQEGSERYDFTYLEDAWASMDGLLDDQEKKRNKRILGWWILAGVGITILVSVLAVTFYGKDQSPLKKPEVVEGPIASVLPSLKEKTVKEALTPITDTDTDTEKITTESVDRSNTISEVTAIADLPTKILSETIENNNPVSPSTNETVQIAVETDQPSSSTNQNEGTTIATKDEITEPTSEIASSAPQTIETKENPVVLPSGAFTLLSEKLIDHSTISIPEIKLVESVKKSDDGKRKLINRFSVGLTIGPEFSFVGEFEQAKGGYYLGLELGYQLSKRFELVTGVGVSKKEYLGDGAKYKAEPGFWTDAIVPMEFSGSCTVIEIPLAVNYYFNGAKENGWFASLGATTYVMTDEWYDFIYDPSIDSSNLKASWSNKGANDQSSHLLGVGQVSFGYQKNLGKHTSLQISPYAKIPLTGIGHGSVNLFSTGLRITARLRK